jgi:hypothetical protein
MACVGAGGAGLPHAAVALTIMSTASRAPAVGPDCYYGSPPRGCYKPPELGKKLVTMNKLGMRPGRGGRVLRMCCGAATGVAIAALLTGCGASTPVLGKFLPDFQPDQTAAAPAGQATGSRFSQVFGANTQALGEPSPMARIEGGGGNCPPISVRPGESTVSGGQGSYQVTITRIARDCVANGGVIAASVGIEGRLTLNSGAPAAIEVPLRIDVVEKAGRDKIVFTRFYRTIATADNPTFSFVAEDVVYPVPPPGTGDSYAFSVGLDANSLNPEQPRAKKSTKPKG